MNEERKTPEQRAKKLLRDIMEHVEVEQTARKVEASLEFEKVMPLVFAYADEQTAAAQEQTKALTACLQANNRMLHLLAPLLADGPHVHKIKFVEEQIEANRITLAASAPGPQGRAQA